MAIYSKVNVPKIDIPKTKIANKEVYKIKDDTNKTSEILNIKNNTIDDVDIVLTSTIFDSDNSDNDSFGGSQGALVQNIENFIEDENVLEIVQSYYPDATKEDLEFLFNKINSIGCGYVAAVNVIFLAFQYIANGQGEFEKIFGYSMLVNKENPETGEYYMGYRYEYMLLDFFLYYAKNERGFQSIEDVYGDIGTDSIDSALDDSGASSSGMAGTQLAGVAKVLKDFLDYKGASEVLGNITYDDKIELFPGTEAWEKKKEEMEAMGITVNDDDVMYETKPSSEFFEQALNEGKIINIRDSSFTLYYPYDADGNGELDDIYASDIGAHAMTLVEVLDDGRFIVSSWGKEFIYDYNEDNSNFGFIAYTFE